MTNIRYKGFTNDAARAFQTVKRVSWALSVASAALLTLCAPAAHADVVTTVTTPAHFWGNSIQGTSVGYDSRDAAATGGASYYCALPENANYFLSCSYGGMDANGQVTIVINQGSYAPITVHEYWSCNVGGQMMGQIVDTWKDANGISHTPACVKFSASPPPPPPPKVVAIDPGHGFTCPAKGMPLGAVGVTDFPPNDPPAGRLREDELTMAIAREVQRILPTSKYKVVLTKRNVNECPDYWDRGRVANIAEAKAFVSIHINKALVVPVINVPLPVGHGTSVLYNVEKSGSFNLAYSMARTVSSSLGVNNRGVMVDDELAVLKPKVTEMNAVLVEVARLSGTDETKLHTSGSATRIATGIKAALDESLGN